MLWRTSQNKGGEYKPKTSELFLKRCRRLIVWWFVILILMMGFAVVVDLDGGKSKTWAKPLFVVACVLDLIVTCHILPNVFQVLKDELSKESFVKKKLWKLRFLVFINLFFSLAFIAWVWMASDADLAQKIIKWLLCVVLAMGVLMIKGFFIHTFIVLKKYISKLFVEFKVVEREEHSSEDNNFTPKESNPNLLESGSNPIKVLE